MLEELEGREEKGRLDIWDRMGGVTSKSKVELRSKSSEWCELLAQEQGGRRQMVVEPGKQNLVQGNTCRGGECKEECVEGKSRTDGMRS